MAFHEVPIASHSEISNLPDILAATLSLGQDTAEVLGFETFEVPNLRLGSQELAVSGQQSILSGAEVQGKNCVGFGELLVVLISHDLLTTWIVVLMTSQNGVAAASVSGSITSVQPSWNEKKKQEKKANQWTCHRTESERWTVLDHVGP
jgi:hypothetical protein